MEYEDRITISAPEGIELEYELAGLGSRFIAELIDLVLRVVVLGAVIALLAVAGAGSTTLLIVFVLGSFLALFGYDIAFEVWAAGRTPGKRWSGLRVLMASGRQVSFGASAVRNLIRIVDMWATMFIAGVSSILLTRRNQRLGDLAAGTIVVRERHGDGAVIVAAGAAPTVAAGAGHALDVTAIGPPELAAIRDFVARREKLKPDARARVARALADTVGAKVGGVPAGSLEPERLLELILTAKSEQRYGSGPSI